MRYNFGRDITELKEQAINNINQAAYDKINLNYPIYKQINLNTRAIELILLGNKISNEEKIELQTIQTMFKYINTIRELTNTLIEDITIVTNPNKLREIEIKNIEQIKNV